MASKKTYVASHVGWLVHCVTRCALATGAAPPLPYHVLFNQKLLEYTRQNQSFVLERRLTDEIGLSPANAGDLAVLVMDTLIHLWHLRPATYLTGDRLLKMRTCRELMRWILMNYR